jgi:hypothetical protein
MKANVRKMMQEAAKAKEPLPLPSCDELIAERRCLRHGRFSQSL